MGLGDLLGLLVAERAWELPAAGATLHERWVAIAPELALAAVVPRRAGRLRLFAAGRYPAEWLSAQTIKGEPWS